MISRYVAIFTISASFIVFLILATSNIKISSLDKTSTKVKAASTKVDDLNPVKKENPQNPPEISAKSAVIIDAKTVTSLYEKNPNLKHLPASTTKLMTALVALEKCNPEDVITVDYLEKEGTQMGLTEGDQVTTENLLYGLLISSGNDAAIVLANNCSDSIKSFVNSMNDKAQKLNMQNTHFTNPTGFDDNLQFSTALDLARLANVAISNPLISKIVAIKSTVVTNISGTKAYYLENINELLGKIDGVEGIKTGQTSGSQENLITKTTRSGNSIVVSVLGSQDRFGESQQLIEWAFASHTWKEPN